MKKRFVLRISLVFILAVIFFALFSMNAAAVVTIRDNPVPLAGDVVFEDDAEETATELVSPKTGDLTIQLSISAVVLAGTAGIISAGKRKFKAE